MTQQVQREILVSVSAYEVAAVNTLIRELAEMVLQLKPGNEAQIEEMLSAHFKARELLTKASALRFGEAFLQCIATSRR